MKKTLLMLIVMLGCVTISAQNLSRKEMRQMQAFLTQT